MSLKDVVSIFLNLNTFLNFCVILGLMMDKDNFSFKFLVIFFTICLIIWILAVIKVITIHLDEQKRPAKIWKIRRNLLIGYGGITVAGIVPQLWIVFNQGDAAVIICVVCNFVPLIFQKLFIKKGYKVPKKKFPIRLFFIIIDLLLIITLISVSHQLDYSIKQLTIIYIIIIWYTVIFLWAFLEFFAILVNGIKLTSQEEEYEDVEEGERPINEEQGTVVPEDNPEEKILENLEIDQSLPTCNICMLNYSNPTVIPLILIGCGHTVCQKCVRKFPRHENNTILCPFCRQPTNYTDDQENQLPKNFAILEMIEMNSLFNYPN